MWPCKMTTAHHGFDGRLYPVKARKDKIVIALGGSEGGLWLAKKQARWLQAQGMPALAVGYFGTPGTGKQLTLVPLEIIENALSYLKEQGYGHIGILGISKGAEFALVAAAHFPVIDCVIAKTPSWFVGEGITGRAPSGTSSWSWQKKALAYTPYRERQFHAVRRILRAGEYTLLSLNTGKSVVADAIIPVERTNGPVLLLSTHSDTIWPSEASGNQLSLRLFQNHFSHPYRHVCYRYMGHFMQEKTMLVMRILFRSERRHR